MENHGEFMRAANERRLASFRKNSRLFKGVRWLGTLDCSSCIVCAALDGATWDLNGSPIAGNPIGFRVPPLHPGCRCSLTGALKRDGGPDRRASQFGQISGDTSFDAFLKRMKPDQVERFLGKGRAELLSSGMLSVRDFISPDCRERTLPELHALLAERP